MKHLKTFVIICMLLSTTGCAGLFVAGAATTVNVVTDTRTTQEMWDDNNIEFEVAGLANKPPFQREVRITASSYDGTVVLMGQASNQDLLNQFVSKTRDLKGVKKVHNQVRIKAPLSVGQISHDSWITTKVKSALLTNSELNGVKVKVITEDKEVFLLGYVSPEQADVAVEVARNISGVKQVIKAFQTGN
ncbi:BON domain-containing protein [Vibrio sp. Isolate25]|uniref:BON domain-containing protein n=1 Tax=Vibrio TaxID=662 RepID=UPI001EFD9E76|nr:MULTISPECIES: BON domain-containing protein [Vibrio]MCG9596527.1 BON domain-containing protein [Vibrio sp. Isolate25]MCG9678129.1 BON domain-containing protein [Vibrio sp. Isolate24]USD32005.1 BON domain-containing protein [Vibrio sp. SCSIO 43186]USD45047.1 BON domain-containing protein [Vibrio sp. SCSIO 43145]USD69128.1 BON domain-containing protein [Vibrio sp. SCSIO 43139]